MKTARQMASPTEIQDTVERKYTQQTPIDGEHIALLLQILKSPRIPAREAFAYLNWTNGYIPVSSICKLSIWFYETTIFML